MSQPFAVVDAFTNRPFAGNPAAVCVLAAPAQVDWMAAVAREMNLAETAFTWPEGDRMRLRWFTPTIEVSLCGHATLATAHALWESGRLPAGEAARFISQSGELGAQKRDDGWIALDFPAKPLAALEGGAGIDCKAALSAALGAPALWVGRNDLHWVVELTDEAAVRAVRPDFAAIERMGGVGVIITAAASTPGVDFVSRFFAPAAGILEDPVTGAAHCGLTPHWAARLDRRDLVAQQVSARGGALRVGMRGARVEIAGQAVTVTRGEILF